MAEFARFRPNEYLSAAVKAGNLAFVSGQVPADLDSDLIGQSQSVLAKIDRLLIEVGSDKSKIAYAMIWLKDIADRNRFNEVWIQWVADSPPARACVQAELPILVCSLKSLWWRLFQ
jgi:enamine deaminase RidA (YjgF/YER057c/UK114 family)